MARPRNLQPAPESPAETIGCLAALTRMAWLVFGGVALAILSLLIAREGEYSLLDFAYWGVVVVMAVMRLVDITHYQGLTSTGEPATLRTWRRYLLVLVVSTGALWAAAHLVLTHFVHRSTP
jgi:hypothetical protein